MYQGNQTQQNYGAYYPNYNAYTVPYQQRYDNNTIPTQMNYTTGNYLKGRPVVSLEEARAAQIDLDGSLHIFTDLANKKIYTKQINLDGTATLNIYSLEEENSKTPSVEYITRAEFDQALGQIQSMLNIITAKEEEKKVTTLKDF